MKKINKLKTLMKFSMHKAVVAISVVTLFITSCQKTELQSPPVQQQPVSASVSAKTKANVIPVQILEQLYSDYIKAGEPDKAARLKKNFNFTTGLATNDGLNEPVAERLIFGVGDVVDDITFFDRTGGLCQSHIQDVGWQSVDFMAMNSAVAPDAFDNTAPQPWQIMGTTGQSRRLEAFILPRLGAFDFNSNFVNEEIFFRYQSHVADFGWLGQVESPQISGTVGQRKRMEAVAINVFPQTVTIGAQSFRLRVFYRSHLQDTGWTGWVGNGAVSGTTGQNRRLEALQVRVYLVR
jgi:Clostridial hydrophobic W